MKTPNLHCLAQACYSGACNPHGIVRSLAESISEIPPGKCRESLDLKIILGQLSFLIGESLGPQEETIAQFRENEKRLSQAESQTESTTEG
ncbi:MAG TPA: hypothetical protein VN578_21160 [Candidatus Binatia bacterium]|jgi:hypothetical protein|nr:hypothetical protein [Candidatus Binatia bacterium]